MSSAASAVTSPPSSIKAIASSAPASFPPFFRRRPIGRAPSPPMWACYEQIQSQYSDDSSDDDSGSESDENSHTGTDSEEDDPNERPRSTSVPHAGDHMEMDMDVTPVENQNGKMEVDSRKADKEGMCDEAEADDDECGAIQVKKDKGKQRAVEPEVECNEAEKRSSPKKRHQRRRKNHEASFTYRPILTIRKSEGFVWNQDLFVPIYEKDRYLLSDIASTSPPSSNLSNGFTRVPASEFNDNYEIEVVEIRVQGNELDGILS